MFTREELKEREKKQLETLATRMQTDLAQFSLHDRAGGRQGRRRRRWRSASRCSRICAMRKPVGRLVIDLDRSMARAPGSEQDIVLKDGDRLLVPRVTQEVTVIGEVQSATSHLYRADLSRDDYIAMSGGLTPRADDDRIYVVRADGSVVTRSGNAWFRRRRRYQDRATRSSCRSIPSACGRCRCGQRVTTIIYNLAIAVAAINSF